MKESPKHAVSQGSVWGLCEEMRRRGELPKITELRPLFDKPYSMEIHRHWSEWMAANPEFVAEKKGARYGYKRLYELSQSELTVAEERINWESERFEKLRLWLERRSPILYKEWEELNA